MKFFVAVTAVLLVFVQIIGGAFGEVNTENLTNDQIWEGAIESLTMYNASNLQTRINKVKNAYELFQKIDSYYKENFQLLEYTQAMQIILNEKSTDVNEKSVDIQLILTSLERMKNNERLKNILEEKDLPSCEDLYWGITGLMYEWEGDDNLAIECYEKLKLGMFRGLDVRLKRLYTNSDNAPIILLPSITLNANDEVSLGRYFGEDICWIVLEAKGDTAWLLSKNALDVQPYHTELENVTWRTSSLRAWLNNEFYEVAFDEKEKQYILSSSVKADVNTRFPDTDSGRDTEDKVFLLSVDEVNRFFSSAEKAQCYPTESLCSKYGLSVKQSYDWWLRSPGNSQRYAAIFRSTGVYRRSVDYSNVVVRPTIRVNIGAFAE